MPIIASDSLWVARSGMWMMMRFRESGSRMKSSRIEEASQIKAIVASISRSKVLACGKHDGIDSCAMPLTPPMHVGKSIDIIEYPVLYIRCPVGKDVLSHPAL